jgi:hypothetical protein
MSNIVESLVNLVKSELSKNFKVGDNMESVNARAIDRFKICVECPFYNSDTARCKVCGCFLKVKVFGDESKCPKDRW